MERQKKLSGRKFSHKSFFCNQLRHFCPRNFFHFFLKKLTPFLEKPPLFHLQISNFFAYKKWHAIVQKILDEHLSLLCGRIIKEKRREHSQYFFVDYYCIVEDQPDTTLTKNIIRPLDHFKVHNIVEYKSLHESLNEETFREYIGRTLVIENSTPNASHKGQMTLTLFTTRVPKKLFKVKEYNFQRINKWKYRCLQRCRHLYFDTKGNERRGGRRGPRSFANFRRRKKQTERMLGKSSWAITEELKVFGKHYARN